MTHTFTKLTYHCIWSTKNREQLISNEIKNRLYGYIREIVNEKNQKLHIINGMPDHVHLLLGLSPTIALSTFLGHIKSSSTKWLNIKLFNQNSFQWQEGFAGYTVGYSTQNDVINYIQNQEIHHKNMTFDEEYLKFLDMQKIGYDERFVLG